MKNDLSRNKELANSRVSFDQRVDTRGSIGVGLTNYGRNTNMRGSTMAFGYLPRHMTIEDGRAEDCLRTVYKEKREVTSQLKNSPSYTIHPRLTTYKQVITKEHVQDMLGKDAPGVGHYRVSKEPAAKRAPSWAMSMAERFDHINRLESYKVSNKLGHYQGKPDW